MYTRVIPDPKHSQTTTANSTFRKAIINHSFTSRRARAWKNPPNYPNCHKMWSISSFRSISHTQSSVCCVSSRYEKLKTRTATFYGSGFCTLLLSPFPCCATCKHKCRIKNVYSSTFNTLKYFSSGSLETWASESPLLWPFYFLYYTAIDRIYFCD